jgi:hypothetical protein
MANTRVTREVDNREFSERPKQWMNPELLPEPDKEVGYSYRWIRVTTLGQHDPRNISSKLREGYEPVRVEEQPKFRLLVDPTSRYKDNIEIGGLLLCKIPTEFLQQRQEYFDRQTRQQTEAVDNNFMRQSDARMPLFRERSSETRVGRS